MSNPMKYIKDLEAAGFARNQAEAQVQVVLEALEGEFVNKSELGALEQRLDNRFGALEQRLDARFMQIDGRFMQVDHQFAQVDNRFNQLEQSIDKKFVEFELRIMTRLGFLMVSTTSIAVAVLTWLIKP